MLPGLLLQMTNRVIQGIAGAGCHNGRTLNGTAQNIAGNNLPLVVQQNAVLGLGTTLHTVIQIKQISSLRQADLPCVDGTTHDCRESLLGFQVDGFQVCTGTYELGLRENIIVVVLAILVQILQTTFVKALDKIVTGALHQRRAVGIFARDHIYEIDAGLTFACTFRHGDCQELQFAIQNVLITLHHRFQVSAARLIKTLAERLSVLDSLQIIIEEMRGTEHQRPIKQPVELLCQVHALPLCAPVQGFVDARTQHLVVYLVRQRKIFRSPCTNQGEQIIISRKIMRASVNRNQNVRTQSLIVHISSKIKKRPGAYSSQPL